ncbi:MAG: polyprenyl synthetase family protein [Candidatus Njordarchaeales archaeon]
MHKEKQKIQEFTSLLERLRAEVDEGINELISRIPYIRQLAERALRGGKRFRGVLVLVFSRALRGNSRLAKYFAAIIEFIHAATLLHDDFIDGHQVRRGLPAFWKEYGAKLAVLVGDFLFTAASQFTKYISNEALRFLATTIYKITLGVLIETDPKLYTKDITKAYTLMNRLKTGELFGAASYLGVLSSGRREYLRNAYKYGILTGEAYQIADDIFDLRLLKSGVSNVDLKPLKLAILSFCEDKYSVDEILEITKEETLLRIAEEINLEQKLLELMVKRIYAGIEAIQDLPDSFEKKVLIDAPKIMVDIMLRKG